MRLIFIGATVLAASFLVLKSRLMKRNAEKPVFLRTDKIAETHHTKIDIRVHSLHEPDSAEQAALKKDYGNLWAHLNNLYGTNDIEAGKEYYTEDWFKQINHHYEGIIKPVVTRTDEQHQLHIQNWATDGLVCTAIDSNVVFKYSYADKPVQLSRVHLAVVLLYQGDHWRLDAMRVLDQTSTKKDSCR